MTGRDRRTLRGMLALAALLAWEGTAGASDWMYRRSYFSHALPPGVEPGYPLPVSESAHRPAIVSPYPGFGIQETRRFNTVAIPSGASLDVTIQHGHDVRFLP